MSMTPETITLKFDYDRKERGWTAAFVGSVFFIFFLVMLGIQQDFTLGGKLIIFLLLFLLSMSMCVMSSRYWERRKCKTFNTKWLTDFFSKASAPFNFEAAMATLVTAGRLTEDEVARVIQPSNYLDVLPIRGFTDEEAHNLFMLVDGMAHCSRDDVTSQPTGEHFESNQNRVEACLNSLGCDPDYLYSLALHVLLTYMAVQKATEKFPENLEEVFKFNMRILPSGIGFGSPLMLKPYAERSDVDRRAYANWFTRHKQNGSSY